MNRQPFDLDGYVAGIRSGPCFICEILRGNPDYAHHVFYEDAVAIAFLNRYPTLYGYTLVAPRVHREQAIVGFSRGDYHALQDVIYRVGQAIDAVLRPERLYVLSLGSQQGNAHVHWHLAPLPPGIPFEDQQFAALDMTRGLLNIGDDDMRELADRLRQAMAGTA